MEPIKKDEDEFSPGGYIPDSGSTRDILRRLRVSFRTSKRDADTLEIDTAGCALIKSVCGVLANLET